ncbi:hypothetical protein D3C71_1810150 [compost metagenome]
MSAPKGSKATSEDMPCVALRTVAAAVEGEGSTGLRRRALGLAKMDSVSEGGRWRVEAPRADERQWLDQHGCASSCFFMLHQMRVILICVDVWLPHLYGRPGEKKPAKAGFC